MQDLSNNQLLEIYNSKFEFSYIDTKGNIIHTDDELEIENIDYCIFHSDFETMFEIKDELVKRNILIQ